MRSVEEADVRVEFTLRHPFVDLRNVSVSVGRLVNVSAAAANLMELAANISERIEVVIWLSRMPWKKQDTLELVISFAAEQIKSSQDNVRIVLLVENMNFTIVLTPEPSLLNPTVAKAAEVANAIGGVLAPSVTALQLASVASFLELSQCAFSHFDQLPFSLSPFGWCFGEASGQCYRGAVAAHLFFVAVSGAVGVTASSVMTIKELRDGHAATSRIALNSAMASLRFPSILVVVHAFVMQGTITCSIALLTVASSYGVIYWAVAA